MTSDASPATSPESIAASAVATRLASPLDLGARATNRALTAVARLRNRFLPVLAVVVAIVVWLDPAPWRVIAISLAGAGLLATAIYEHLHPEAMNARHFGMVLVVGSVGQLVAVFATGGIAGPAMPALAVLTMLAALLSPPRRSRMLLVFVQIPAVWAFAWAQSSGIVPDLVPNEWAGQWAAAGTPGPGPWIAVSIYTFIMVVANVIGATVRELVLNLVYEGLAERDEQLELLRESSRALTRMSAEIAHELKNPLASIKGLAALVHKDLHGTPAERMDVLRREVDRMQSILEDFLTHSRPLVPLDERAVDLVELAADVVALHEATAAQRGVRMEPPTGTVSVRCDPRKIRQVLINLVQNALDATNEGGWVRVEVQRNEGGATIRVLDEGTGIAPDVAESLFSVGVTSKAHGTGIGLAVARGLARQHGGDLDLRNRARGGCVATLELPAAPPVAAEVAE